MKNLTNEMKVLVGVLSGVAIVVLVGTIWWISSGQDNVITDDDVIVEDQSGTLDGDSWDKEIEDQSEGDQSETVVTEENLQEEWLTYTLGNPRLTFKYPEGLAITTDYSESGELTMQISGSKGAVSLFMYEGVAGPGVGGFPEISNPSVQKSVGLFFGHNLIRVESTDTSGYAMLVTKCKDPASCGGIPEPGCACSDINNYVMSNIYSTDLEWTNSGDSKTYIMLELKGNCTEEEKNTYDQILNTFSKD